MSIASIVLIVKSLLSRNIKQVGFGDIRSTVSVFLYSIFKNADLLMFDDGAFSFYVDDVVGSKAV